MSIFLQSTASFRKEFHVGKRDSLRLYLWYPRFRAIWLSEYGGGFRQFFAKQFLSWQPSKRFWIKIRGFQNRSLNLPIHSSFSDINSFREIFWGKEYDTPFNLSECETYVDLGANTGMATYYFLAKGGFKRALAIEANPQLANRMKEECRQAAPFAEIQVENLAVTGSKEGEIMFFVSDDHRMSSIEQPPNRKGKNVRVKMSPLRSLLEKNHFQNIDLLKMDIEGAEYELLETDAAIFDKVRYLCAELHGNKPKRNQFKNKLAELGFELLEQREMPHLCETIFARNTKR